MAKQKMPVKRDELAAGTSGHGFFFVLNGSIPELAILSIPEY